MSVKSKSRTELVTESHVPVQTEAAFVLQNRPVSDLKPHMKEAQIWFERIRFHMTADKNNQIWATRAGFLRT